MSDRMKPIPFNALINWIMTEYKKNNSIFGIRKAKFYKNQTGTYITLFNEKIATPLGPAAGPHTQLAQNIIASYLTGCRFMELKTVQIIDGEDLPVSKPCIRATDEGYNVEWSTELTVQEAFNEYVKAWFVLHVLMKELELSDTRDFMFNMSVGYDLAGIKSKKIDDFIEGLKDARNTPIWQECYNFLAENIAMFRRFTIDDLQNISPKIANSITLSTLHGCPPEEIEKIVTYLLEEKHLNTYIKLNPTLLGEEFVSQTLKQMGYDYIVLNPHHFKHDLQYDDGVQMLRRLKEKATSLGLQVGVKLSNTLPVRILNHELPGEEMYMSGRALYPLTINMAKRLANEFNGDLLISYAGGIDFFNIKKVLQVGIQPITFATTLLKPGGYERITQMALYIEKDIKNYDKIDVEKLNKLAEDALTNKYHLKERKPVEIRKISSSLPLFDCAIAPCKNGCPINQDIPEYIKLVGEERFAEALEVILKDNSAPMITGTLCPHFCQDKCTRLDYDESIQIRNMKKIAALNAQKTYIENLKPVELRSDKRVGIIGAGPAGLACAFFLRRNGVAVTVMDKQDKPYGMVQYLIPKFRIAREEIDLDYQLVEKSGVEFKFNCNPHFNIDELLKEYDYLILAIGTWIPEQLKLDVGTDRVINAFDFLKMFNEDSDKLNVGKKVVIVGGGDVAIDCARSAKRLPNVEEVQIVYRRTKAFMPASREEIKLAEQEGIQIKELRQPVSFIDGKLRVNIMELGSPDFSGRRRPVPTEKYEDIECDYVISAIGEHVDRDLLITNGISLNNNGYPVVNEELETSRTNVFIAGDAKSGPRTIVEAISDAKKVSKAILNRLGLSDIYRVQDFEFNETELYNRKGILKDALTNEEEATRCLACNKVCELCVDVCPNRANVKVIVNGKHQIVHLDALCNECGNCGIFCPYQGNPYKDKVTIFDDLASFEDSTNTGFVRLNDTHIKVRTKAGEVVDYYLGDENTISKDLRKIIMVCINEYPYLFWKEEVK